MDSPVDRDNPAARRPVQHKGLPWWTLVIGVVGLAGLAILYQALIGGIVADARAATVQYLPRLGLAVGVVLVGTIVAFAFRLTLRKTVRVERLRYTSDRIGSSAIYAITIIGAISALIGDLTGLAVSVGLVGFGITLALQTPILSGVGWFLINARRLFAPGDRIAIGAVKGDVMQIGFLNTVLWEFGSDWIKSDRPSGRQVSIPNKMVLENPVYNYTADFPYVWDEIAQPVANEGDWRLARQLMLEAGDEVVGNDAMRTAVESYERILATHFQPYALSKTPGVTMSLDDSWNTLTLRYLVHIDRRASVKTLLAETIVDKFAAHPDELPPIYRRSQTQRLDAGGRPLDRTGERAGP